jgi:hypothetical protein
MIRFQVHLIDLFNMIETFRDNSLHTMDTQTAELDQSKLECIIQSMYTKLNMRLSMSQQVNVDAMTTLLTCWLVNVYDKHNLNKISLFAFKIALTTLCSGKMIDKLKCKFCLFHLLKSTTTATTTTTALSKRRVHADQRLANESAGAREIRIVSERDP